MFRGSIPALITPFTAGASSVDEGAFADLVAWHIECGSRAVVPCGTTGESPTLSHAEHKRVVELCVEAAGGRIPVIAGAGSNSTAEARDFARHGESAGADGLLVVTPYYNKPDQEGLYRHFMEVRAGVEEIPVILYNIPSRSIVDVSVETCKRLYEAGAIVGVKDATGDVGRVSETRARIGDKFLQLSGNDDSALGFMAHGGHGCISVTANAAPRECAEFQEACLSGDFARALALQDRLMDLHRALFAQPSPAPVKHALALLGKCGEETRLPLAPLREEVKALVSAAMGRAGLLDG